MSNLEDIFIDEIGQEFLSDMPKQILEFYRNLPGRKPSDHSKRISTIISLLNDEDAISLIRDVIDRSCFSFLYKIDFQDHIYKINFNIQDVAKTSETQSETDLAEKYRGKYDPGGLRRT